MIKGGVFAGFFWGILWGFLGIFWDFLGFFENFWGDFLLWQQIKGDTSGSGGSSIGSVPRRVITGGMGTLLLRSIIFNNLPLSMCF